MTSCAYAHEHASVLPSLVQYNFVFQYSQKRFQYGVFTYRRKMNKDYVIIIPTQNSCTTWRVLYNLNVTKYNFLFAVDSLFFQKRSVVKVIVLQ